MSRAEFDANARRHAIRIRSQMMEREAERLFRMALADMERTTPDDYAPGADAHDRRNDR